MWRAYGGRSSVAIFLKLDPFINSPAERGLQTLPVVYGNKGYIRNSLRKIASGIGELHDQFNLKYEEIDAYLFDAFLEMIVCFKHDGFSEEREWRIVFNPKMTNHSRLTKKLVSFPQGIERVYSLKIDDTLDSDAFSNPNDLIDRVVIGPVENAISAREVVIDVLETAKVDQAASKVVLSNIPLR